MKFILLFLLITFGMASCNVFRREKSLIATIVENQNNVFGDSGTL